MANKLIDPVCGMHVDPDKSPYHWEYQEHSYLFCSVYCLEKFKQNPEQFLHASLEQEEVLSNAGYTCPMHPEIQQNHSGICPICGMALEPKKFEVQTEHIEYQEMKKRFWVGLILTLPVLLLAMGSMIPEWNSFIPTYFTRWGQFFLSTPVILWGGWPFFERAWYSIHNRHLNMFSLIALGIGIAYLFSVIALFFPHLFPALFHHQGEVPLYFETAALITILVLLGQVLELRARSQTSQAIQALLNRAAKFAILIDYGREKEIPVDQVKISDLLRVRPGDKVPVDGKILEGKSWLDESMMTGESLPIEKTRGNHVIGGTINQSGSFIMQAEKVGNETLLTRMIEMVAQAQRSRAPIQSLADQVSAYFVPTVIGIAFLTFILWTWLGPSPSFVYGLVNAVAVLIIACPCALGLATPMSIMVGLGKGAEQGVLIKNAEALEKLEKVKVLIVDKTGTLTEGHPKLTKIIPLLPKSEKELLFFAAAVEQNSEHPLAKAIVRKAQESLSYFPRAENFQAISGQGVSAKVEGDEILLGNLLFLKSKRIQNLDHLESKALALNEYASSLIYLAINDQAAAIFEIEDPIKDSAFHLVNQLQDLGLKIITLSGDQEKIVQAVNKKLGIDEGIAHVLPQNKQNFVREVQQKYGLVAMAGDGINDAPALAVADVGIAMGTGTDVAMESAGITLVKGDLQGIVKAIHLSQAMMRNIRQNLFFAFIYNVVGVFIATGALYPWTGLLLNPVIAALAMSFSSVSVIANALRLR